MALEDLVFKLISTNEIIYEPAQVVAGVSKQISITNLGEDTLTNLGIYVIPASSLGDVDNPADYPPETDYQDLIKWGTESQLAIEPSGGIYLTVPQTSGTNSFYVTRTAGSTIENMIALKDIAPSESVTITIDLETPPSVLARRLYIGLAVNQVS